MDIKINQISDLKSGKYLFSLPDDYYLFDDRNARRIVGNEFVNDGWPDRTYSLYQKANNRLPDGKERYVEFTLIKVE